MFILSMRIFDEHILGTQPMDQFFHMNGWLESSRFPDVFASSGLGGACGNSLAAVHGPIEEQARLMIYPDMLLYFVHTASEAWLQSVLRGSTAQGSRLLRGWQERVLVAAQSMQIDSAAVLPLLLVDNIETAAPPRSTPFSRQHQKDCRFHGELEGDARDPTRRRPLLAEEDLFIDHYIREHLEQLPTDVEPPPINRLKYKLLLTGAQITRRPKYRLLQSMLGRIPRSAEDNREEAALWSQAFCEDYRLHVADSMIHVHKDTCFKYVIQEGLWKSKHCRFHYNHFVTLARQEEIDGALKIRDVTFARTGFRVA